MHTLAHRHAAVQHCAWPCPMMTSYLTCRMQLEQASVRTLLAAGRQADAQEAAVGLFNECMQAGLQVC